MKTPKQTIEENESLFSKAKNKINSSYCHSFISKSKEECNGEGILEIAKQATEENEKK